MPGGVPEGFHEGFNSEKWAEAVLSKIGTAVRVPPSDDLGLDLYCTLLEREHPLLVPRGYYVVQVKSRREPWVFKNQKAVRWLVRYPLPIFYCVINKSRARVSVFQTLARFHAWTRPDFPERLELVPGKRIQGQTNQLQGGETYSLGAPILEFPVTRILEDKEFCGTAAGILKYWIDLDNKNIQHVSHNNHRVEMPHRYATNALPGGARVMQSLNMVDRKELEMAVSHLREPLDGVSQHLFRGDLLAAVRGMLLLRQLYWDDFHAPSTLNMHSRKLDSLLGKTSTAYAYETVDALGSLLDVAVLEALKDSEHLQHLQRIYLTGKDVTDNVIEPLHGACEVKRICLNRTRITDDGIRHLNGLTELEILSVSGAHITDKSINVIKHFEKLTLLNLVDTQITGAGLRHLRTLKHLEQLYLNGTKVDDEGLKYIGRLPMLRVLTLNHTKITDIGLRHLRLAHSLRKLELIGTRTTDTEVDALQEVNPDLNVIRAESSKEIPA